MYGSLIGWWSPDLSGRLGLEALSGFPKTNINFVGKEYENGNDSGLDEAMCSTIHMVFSPADTVHQFTDAGTALCLCLECGRIF
jgi:hypothetical protein